MKVVEGIHLQRCFCKIVNSFTDGPFAGFLDSLVQVRAANRSCVFVAVMGG